MCQMSTTGIILGRPNISENYSSNILMKWGHWPSRRTRSEICQPTTLGAEAGIYRSFLGLLSVLYNANQLLQELLFKLVLLTLLTNFQTKSILFPTSFKIPPIQSQIPFMNILKFRNPQNTSHTCF